MTRESWSTPIQAPHFQSTSGMLSHTGGTYFHIGMVDYPRNLFLELNLGKCPDSMEFHRWNVNFRTEVCLRTADPRRTYIAIDCGPNWFPWFRYAWCDDCICIENACQHAVKFLEQSKCRRAASSETRLIPSRNTNCVHDLRAFPCNWRLWSSTRTLISVRYELTEWRRPGFRRHMGSWLSICERSTLRYDPGRIGQVKIGKFCSTPDCDGFIWSRNGANEGANLSSIEDSCRNFISIKQWELETSGSGTMLWKEDQSTKSQKGNESLRWEGRGRVFSVEGTWTIFPKETHVVSVMTYSPVETRAKVRDEKGDRLLLQRQKRLTARDKNLKAIRQKRGQLFGQEWNAMPVRIL